MLSDSELAAMREVQEAAMPETVVVQHIVAKGTIDERI